MRILVTGGAGYIGAATARALIRAGHTVTIVDSLIKGHRNAIPKAAQFVQADLGDRDKISSLLARQSCDAIMHFAAFMEAGESMQDPGRFFENNFSNSLSLIEEAARSGI